MVNVSDACLRSELLPVGPDHFFELFKVLRFVLVPEVGFHRTPHLSGIQVWALSWTLPPVHLVSFEEPLDIPTGVLGVLIQTVSFRIALFDEWKKGG